MFYITYVYSANFSLHRMCTLPPPLTPTCSPPLTLAEQVITRQRFVAAGVRVRIEEEVAAVVCGQRAVLPVVPGYVAAVVPMAVARIRQQVPVLFAALDAAIAAA